MFEAQGEDGSIPKWIGVIQRVSQREFKERDGHVRNASSDTHGSSQQGAEVEGDPRVHSWPPL